MTMRIFVSRDAGAIAVGADEVALALAQAAAKRGLVIEIVRTGSRGLYWLEPMIEVATPQGRVAFGPVTQFDASSVLDAMISRANFIRGDVKGLRESFGNPDKPGEDFGPFAGEARHLYGIEEFGSQPRPGIARDRHVVDFTDSDACGVQAITDCRRWKSCRILHAVKSLLLDSGDQPAIGNQSRGSVAVICVDPQYVHPEKFPPALRP